MSNPSPTPKTRPRPVPPPRSDVWTVGRLALVAGFLAGLAVQATLGDPGITIDEPLDVRPGRTYVEALRKLGPARFLAPETVDAVFRDNAEHPPLGRWLLGLASTLGEPFEAFLGGPDPFGVHAGRLAPAACFAILVGLVTRSAGRRYGRAAGFAAGAALVAMPRVFAHAHLGALDTFLALFWTAALLAADRALAGPRPIRAMALAGAVWSLALLTKIHAWLLPPVVLAWAVVRLGPRPSRVVPAVAAWAAVGLLLYFAGWPWLWYDPVGRLRDYLGTGVDRVSLQVQYFGSVYRDRDVPWHYPWVYFAATVPPGLHLLGLLGVVRGWRDRRAEPLPFLLLGAIGLFLLLFSTNVPVYDGERLFLLVFPLWAILIGAGFGLAWDRMPRPWMKVALGLVVATQGSAVVATHPFGLSYYNALVGGLPGAERLGLELTYWGDAVDPVLLEHLAREAAPGATVALAPTLHHAQAAAATTPALALKQIRLLDESAADHADWLIVYRRTAYWRPGLRERVARQAPEFVRSRQGVWLSALLRRESGRSP